MRHLDADAYDIEVCKILDGLALDADLQYRVSRALLAQGSLDDHIRLEYLRRVLQVGKPAKEASTSEMVAYYNAAIELAPGDGELVESYVAFLRQAGRPMDASAVIDRVLASLPKESRGSYQALRVRCLMELSDGHAELLDAVEPCIDLLDLGELDRICAIAERLDDTALRCMVLAERFQRNGKRIG